MKNKLAVPLTIALFLSVNLAFAQCTSNEGRILNGKDLIEHRLETSGNVALDAAITHYYLLLSPQYALTCKIYFIKGVYNSWANRPDGNVYLGVPLLDMISKRPGGISMIAYIVAHEMAHLYQYKYLRNNRFFDDTISNNSFELQADYLAGHTLCRSGIVSKNFYTQLFATVQSLGDFDFYRVSHHGTPEQRSNAVDMGLQTCELSYLSNVYENSFYYINPANLLKPFNDKQVIGEFYLYDTGRKLFSKHTIIYFNENGELFFKDNGFYLKIGVGHLTQNTRDSWTFEIAYNNGIIHIKKDDSEKILDGDGQKIGEYFMYTGFVSHGAPLTLNLHQSNPVILSETSQYPPSIYFFNGILYLTFLNKDNQVALLTSPDGINFSTKSILSTKVVNQPSVACFNGNIYLCWLDTLNHPVVAKSSNGVTWKTTVLNKQSGYDRISMTTFSNALFFAWRDINSYVNVMSTVNGEHFTMTAKLKEQSARTPCLFVLYDDIFVGGTDLTTGQAFTIQSYNGAEFFNKMTILYLSPNSAFQVGTRYVPQVELTEEWFCWKSNINANIELTNSFAEINKIEFSVGCYQEPSFSLPYFAWTEDSAPHRIAIAQMLQN